jgi:molecular chaperone DnaK (HSP70)
MARIIGIDLGTSTTCVSVVENGTPTVIPSVRASKVTPSYLYVMDDGRMLVGLIAKAEVIADPYNTIWATKRLIGRRYNDPTVQECKERLSYKIVPSEKGEVLVTARGKQFTPVKIASLILKFVNRLASFYLKEEARKAVITVPASFNDLQRKATKMAGDMIGMEVVRLVNEPTAAALAWGYHEESERTIAVYDLGGGTFDVSILAIGHGVYSVLATRGDSWLGGEDFDKRLVDHIIKGFRKKHGVDIYKDKMAHQRIKSVAENAKIDLSSKESVRICLESPCPDVVHADVDATVTRPQFESMIEDLVDRTIETFKKTLEDAEMDIDELDSVVLVGGMTRLPLVRQKIEELIERPVDSSVNPDEAIAIGAALHASALAGEKILLSPPESTRQKPARVDKVEMLEAMFNAPVTVGEAWQEDQQSDEPLPAGQAAARNGFELSSPAVKVNEGIPEAIPVDEPAVAPAEPRTADAPLLIDVLSQSLGISDMAGLFVPLIKNNSKLPAKVSQVVTTCTDRQKAIRISVYQGEKRYAKDQVMLGEFVLQGIETASRGVPEVKVTFKIDQSGLFTVSAKDLKTNVEKQILIEDVLIGEGGQAPSYIAGKESTKTP